MSEQNENEATEVPAPQKLREFLSEKLHEGFNLQAGGIGAQLVTDWMVVAEVHGADGPVLRLIDGGQPMWRSVGLLKFGLMDAMSDVLALNGSEEE